MPGGLGTLDELFEALTLIQTEKSKPFLSYLSVIATVELLNWIKERLLTEENISPEDLNLIQIVETPRKYCLHLINSM